MDIGRRMGVSVRRCGICDQDLADKDTHLGAAGQGGGAAGSASGGTSVQVPPSCQSGVGQACQAAGSIRSLPVLASVLYFELPAKHSSRSSKRIGLVPPWLERPRTLIWGWVCDDHALMFAASGLLAFVQAGHARQEGHPPQPPV